MLSKYPAFDEPLRAGLSRRDFIGALTVGGACGIGALSNAFPMQAMAAYADDASGNASDAAPAMTEAKSKEAIAPYAVPSVTSAQEKKNDPKRLLVVVDYQVDFVSGGVFGDIATARAIEDALCEKIEEYRQADDLIIYTMDTHPADDYANTREGAVNPPHCVPGTEGWELYGKVRDLLSPDSAILVKKGTYGSKDLPFVVEAIRAQGVFIQSIEFAGVSTTCRVLHNAIMLYNFFPEIPLVMDCRTTASYTDEKTADQLDELESWGFIVKR